LYNNLNISVVNYNYLGLEKGLKRALVFSSIENTSNNTFANPIVRNDNIESFDFLQKKENRIIIPEGEWTISKDLVIPNGKRFEIQAGAKIDLINQSKIISYSPIFSNGTSSNPIVINSSDATSEGIVIMRATERSQLTHTLFNQLSRPEETGWRLSGAVTFYESPVDISDCIFSNNKIGDDFLNIVRSDFLIEKSQFKNILSDAFDCDFCTGKVSDTDFTNIGNDGIDVSGTQLEVVNVRMDGVGDKGLSAGENSQMTASQIDIKNAEIAITSKDQSLLTITDSKMSGSRIGMALFQKKPEFGPGFIKAERVEMGQSEIAYLIEANSELVVDGEMVESNNENVKKILYGAEFGKSSK
jgi:hypothetical protein